MKSEYSLHLLFFSIIDKCPTIFLLPELSSLIQCKLEPEFYILQRFVTNVLSQLLGDFPAQSFSKFELTQSPGDNPKYWEISFNNFQKSKTYQKPNPYHSSFQYTQTHAFAIASLSISLNFIAAGSDPKPINTLPSPFAVGNPKTLRPVSWIILYIFVFS